MAKCSGITRAGAACKGIPIEDSQWCYAHHPDHAEERRRYGSKGGRRAGRGRPQVEVNAVKARLWTLSQDTLAGRVDKGVGAVGAQILNVYLRAVTVEMKVRELTELEERIAALEDAKEEQRWGA
jgi:hypothetical protein